jgi:hypothetical protein
MGGVGVTMVRQNGTMFAGDSQEIVIFIDAEPESLVGSSFVWALMTRNEWSILVTKSFGQGATLSESTITIKLDPDETEELAGAYYHEAELTDSNGNVSTILTGTITIKPSGIGGTQS